MTNLENVFESFNYYIIYPFRYVKLIVILNIIFVKYKFKCEIWVSFIFHTNDNSDIFFYFLNWHINC